MSSNNTCSKNIAGSSALYLAFCLSPSFAADHAGIVLVSTGEVTAEQPSESNRPLTRKSPILVGDRIRTGAGAAVQIRFDDGAMVALNADSEYQVNAFHPAEAQQGSNITTLVKGGLRTITGAVARENPSAHQVNTPLAAIGVRGTHFSVNVGSAVVVGVWRGEISVNNSGGRLLLGANQGFSFAQVNQSSAAPAGLLEPPPALLPPAVTTKSPAEAAKNSGTAAATTSTTDAASTTNTQQSATAVTAGTETQPVEQPTANNTTVTTFSGATSDNKNTGLDTSASQDFTTLGAEDLITAVKLDTPVTTDANQDGIVDGLQSAIDQRLSATEVQNLTRFGALVAGGPSDGPTYIGKAGTDDNGNPLFTYTGLSPDDVGYDTTTPIYVIRQGTAPAPSQTTFAKYDVWLGAWPASASTPLAAQSDAIDATIVQPLTSNFWWLSIGAASLQPLGALTGAVSYRNVLGFEGGSTSGNIANLFANGKVDFDLNTVDLGLNIHVGTTEVWQMKLAGSLNGRDILLAVDPSSQITDYTLPATYSADGSLSARLVGSGGEGIAGGFNFVSTSGPTRDVDGMFLIDNIDPGDLRLSQSDLNSLSYMSLGSIEGPNGHAFRGSADRVTGAATLLVDEKIDPNTQLRAHVMRHDKAPIAGTTASASYDVTWGYWDGTLTSAVSEHYDPNDPLLFHAISQRLYWLTATPTPAAVISALQSNAKTGTWSGSAIEFQGRDNTGAPLSTLSFNSTINFGNGQISATQLQAVTANGTWNAQFNPSVIAGPRIDLFVDSANSLLTTSGATTLNINGKLAGTLVGNNGDGIAAAFQLDAGQAPAATMQLNGTFVKAGVITP